MRIRLVQGKQKELILIAKGKQTWKKLARKLSLNEQYLGRELVNEKRLISNETYSKLCELSGKKYGKYLVERLNKHWGRSKGGKLSSGNTKEINIPKDSEKLAEFFGIMLGDGNLTSIKKYKVGCYQITITGDSRYDREYLTFHVKPLIENLFKIKVKIRFTNNKNAMVLRASSRKLTEFLKDKGLKPGNKIKNQITMPSWILKNKKFLAKCLMGLYDTDGGIYKLNNQNTYQVEFTNHNQQLLKDVRKNLIKLNIIPSKIICNKKISITKKSQLQRFLKLIGFSNLKHKSKILKWNLVP